MKSHLSFQSARRALIVTSLSLAVGTGVSLAQTSSTDTSQSGSNSRSRSNSSDSTYNSNNTGTNASSTGSYGSTSSSGTTHDHDATMANSSTGATNNSSGKLGFMDKRFVTKAADGGQTEVQIAQLAASQASSPDVKSFAEKLVSDHTAVNQELTTLASSKGVTLDKDDGKDRAYKRLAKKSGADFDREFVEYMIDDHEKDIKMFEKASTDAKDADIRNFASKHLADLRSHLTMAQGLRSSVMPTGREDDTSGRANLKPTNTSSTNDSSSTSTNTSGSYGSTTGTAGTSGSTSTSTSGDATRRGSK